MFQIIPRFYAPCVRQAAKRHFSACAWRGAQRSTVHEVEHQVNVAAFRRMAAKDNQAIVIRQQVVSDASSGSSSDMKHPLLLPALGKWFSHTDSQTSPGLSLALRDHLAHIVPYELILSSESDPNVKDFLAWLQGSSEPIHQSLHPFLQLHTNQQQLQPGNEATSFVRFDAPLALLDAALQFNKTLSPERRFSQLYIAQAALSDLPPNLQLDVLTPGLLANPIDQDDVPYTADIYNSSIWLGLQPTFTPWHRDPNPNLFCQLCSSKVVRLSPPQPGHRLFNKVMAEKLGKPGGNAAIRGDEMMQGSERQAWVDAVWGPDAPEYVSEAVVHPGDALFIPKGWWHSVKSADGSKGALNASVNWWFRWRASPSRRGGS